MTSAVPSHSNTITVTGTAVPSSEDRWLTPQALQLPCRLSALANLNDSSTGDARGSQVETMIESGFNTLGRASVAFSSSERLWTLRENVQRWSGTSALLL